MLKKNNKKAALPLKILVAIVSFIFLIFIRNFAFWSKSQTFIFGDTAVYALYITSLAKNITQLFNLKNNFLIWNPSYLAVGLPTLSIIDLGVFYPPNLIIALIAKIGGDPTSTFSLYTLSLFLHLAFGSFFTSKILKDHWQLDNLSSLIGGLIWLFTGFNLENIAASSIFLTGSYLPVCVYFSLSLVKNKNAKNLFLLFTFLALSFLVGYPIVSLITLLVSTTIILFLLKNLNKVTVIKFIKTLLLWFFLVTIPIIAPLYVSSLINLSYSVRSTTLSLDGFLQNPAEFSEVTEPIIPQNTPFNNLSAINPNYLYFSLVGLMVLIQAGDKLKILKDKKNILFILMGFLGLILSLGKTTSLPALTYFLLPAANLFRRLSVFSIIPSFVFCLLVAQAIKPALRNKKISKILLSLIACLAIILIVSRAINILFSNRQVTVINLPALYQSLGLTFIVIITTLLAFRLYHSLPRLGLFLLFFALLIEGGTVVSTKVYINSQIDPKKIFGPNSLTKEIQRLVKPSERVDILENQNSYSTDFLEIEQTDGYLALASNYGVFINDALNNKMYQPKNLRDILGVKYLVRKSIPPEPNWEKILSLSQNEKEPEFFSFNGTTREWEPEPKDTKYTIYKNPSSLARVYLASAIKTFEQTKEVLKEIENLENSKTVFVREKDLKEKITGQGEVEILEYKRNYLKAKTKTAGPSFLANSTGYYPGWWAKINGKLAKPIQANWFMMGVYLPKGESLVEFFYVPYGILAGLIYVIFSLMFWFIIGKKFTKDLPWLS